MKSARWLGLAGAAALAATYTPEEAAELARQSRLTGWKITRGPLWLAIEGRIP